MRKTKAFQLVVVLALFLPVSLQAAQWIEDGCLNVNASHSAYYPRIAIFNGTP